MAYRCLWIQEGDGSDYENTFWEALGGKKAIAAHTDKNVGETREMRLFRLSDKSGNMTFKQEKNVIIFYGPECACFVFLLLFSF